MLNERDESKKIYSIFHQWQRACTSNITRSFVCELIEREILPSLMRGRIKDFAPFHSGRAHRNASIHERRESVRRSCPG